MEAMTLKCSSCGHTVSADKKFCPECGADLSEQKEKKRKSRKKILIAALTVGLAAAAVFAFFSIGNSKFTPAGTVTAFQDAVENGDTGKLEGLLMTSDEALDVGQEEANALIEYLNGHPDKMDQLLEKLNRDAWIIEESGGKETGSSDEYFASLTLVPEGKGWLLFDDYKLEVIPAYIDMYTNNEEIALTAGEFSGNIPADSEEGIVFGPFLPGTYPVTATFDNTYVIKEVEEEVELFMVRQQEVVHSFDLKVEEVTVSVPEDDFRLVIDGQETDTVLSEGEQSVGLLPIDGSVGLSVKKSFPWGELESPEFALEGKGQYFDRDVMISFTDDEMDTLLQQFNETFRLYQQALSERDSSLLGDGATANYKSDLEEQIKEVNEEKPDYTGKLIETKYNMKRIEHPEYDEELEAYTMRFWIHRKYHEPNVTLGWLFRDTDKDEYTRTGIFTAVYDEEDEMWKIDSYKNDYYVIVTSEEKIYEIEN